MALSHATARKELDQHTTIAHTAERLNVCTKTVRRLISTGELPAIRLGHRTVRIPVDAVNAYIERNTIPTVRREWSQPIPPARNGIEWADPTGETASKHVDDERAADVRQAVSS